MTNRTDMCPVVSALLLAARSEDRGRPIREREAHHQREIRVYRPEEKGVHHLEERGADLQGETKNALQGETEVLERTEVPEGIEVPEETEALEEIEADLQEGTETEVDPLGGIETGGIAAREEDLLMDHQGGAIFLLQTGEMENVR